MEVDWLNILLSVSASHTITELFKASECTVDPNTLDLTFEELDAFSRFPFSDGQLFLAMMTADVKFSPRYAKVFIRTKRLYMLNEDLEIIDLTTDVATGSNSSTPFSTPQKKHKLDCDELDAL